MSDKARTASPRPRSNTRKAGVTRGRKTDLSAGRSPVQRSELSLRWFCVWTVNAVQIEGRQRGIVTIEDRLVLFKARSPRDAENQARLAARKYAEPYLNHRGERVRWQLMSVKDVLELPDLNIDGSGTEVFSRLRGERMRPELRWP